MYKQNEIAVTHDDRIIGKRLQDNKVDILNVNLTNNVDSRPSVSVIIPTLNEAENLPLVLPYLPMNWIDEVVLVDGWSTDNTVDVATRLLPTIKIVTEKVRGKGAALRAGYAAAHGDILIVIDADGSHDPREIPRYVKALMEGADFVKGSRFAPGGGTTDMPRFRKFGNGAFVLLTNLFFGINFTDLCYGYHAFWRYCLESIKLERVNGFEIDTSLYLKAVRARMRIIEVPSFEGYRFHGIGKLQTIPDGICVLRTIFAEWINSYHKNDSDAYLGFRGNTISNTSLLPSASIVESSKSIATINLQFMKILGLLDIGRADMRYVLEGLLQMILQDVHAISGSLILLDENGSVREGYMAYDGKTILISSWSELIQEGLAGWVLKHREATLVPSTHEDPRWLRRSWDESGSGSRSALGVPLMMNDRVVGVLTLVRPQAGQFTENDLSMLTGITEYA